MFCKQEHQTDISGLLLYLHNGEWNVEGEIIIVPSFRCQNFLAELLERLNTSNPAVVQASLASDTLGLT